MDVAVRVDSRGRNKGDSESSEGEGREHRDRRFGDRGVGGEVVKTEDGQGMRPAGVEKGPGMERRERGRERGIVDEGVVLNQGQSGTEAFLYLGCIRTSKPSSTTAPLFQRQR